MQGGSKSLPCGWLQADDDLGYGFRDDLLPGEPSGRFGHLPVLLDLALCRSCWRPRLWPQAPQNVAQRRGPIEGQGLLDEEYAFPNSVPGSIEVSGYEILLKTRYLHACLTHQDR